MVLNHLNMCQLKNNSCDCETRQRWSPDIHRTEVREVSCKRQPTEDCSVSLETRREQTIKKISKKPKAVLCKVKLRARRKILKKASGWSMRQIMLPQLSCWVPGRRVESEVFSVPVKIRPTAQGNQQELDALVIPSHPHRLSIEALWKSHQVLANSGW